jgi:hypothetical protein
MNVKMSPTISRFEVIDETGRVFVREGVVVEMSYQDSGRTLKAFLTAGEPVKRKPGWIGKLLALERKDD